MDLKNREIRTIVCDLAIRENTPNEEGELKDSRTVRGYAIVFNQESQILDEWGMKFREIIEPSAVTEDYLRECDVKMTLFHNREKLLARWNKGQGSLRLFVDEVGVGFEFEAPDTELGDMCIEGVKRGDLSGCSFTFAPGEYEIDETAQPIIIRHKTFSWLGEMTIGSDPAYLQTSVNCRELVGKPNEENEPKVELADVKRELAQRFNNIFIS